ncbi:hypothetical protein C8Q70DRAFT_981404 [Cubamyces menziesii]|nr:hypothetical protein C8Q70DRAFT_981404 [Cubamyces menziesii]
MGTLQTASALLAFVHIGCKWLIDVPQSERGLYPPLGPGSDAVAYKTSGRRPWESGFQRGSRRAGDQDKRRPGV